MRFFFFYETFFFVSPVAFFEKATKKSDKGLNKFTVAESFKPTKIEKDLAKIMEQSEPLELNEVFLIEVRSINTVENQLIFNHSSGLLQKKHSLILPVQLLVHRYLSLLLLFILMFL